MGEGTVRVTWEQVSAFRLSRQHLANPAPSPSLTKVAGDMMGAQAQVLQAALMSLGARLNDSKLENLEAALWKKRTLARAWCMRGTLFLVPSDKLSVFVRGTARRQEYNYRLALERIGSEEGLDRLLDRMVQLLSEPRTRNEMADSLKTLGYKLESKAGGGWGGRRSVLWVHVGTSSLSVGFLLHIMASRFAILSGPNVGAESTYVRADRWVPRWRDTPQDEAEEELLEGYLRAHGPATLADYAIWVGLYVRDATAIWSRVANKLVPVDVEGEKAYILSSDLDDLEKAKLDRPVVRLLPLFDSFILGHKSHRNIVGQTDHRKVYRPQGWVSPVLLVDGRAAGTWSYSQRRETLEVQVAPFSPISRAVSSQVNGKAADLGRFLSCSEVRVKVS